MKKFISIWSILAVLSTAVAIDFYIAIHENHNITDDQLVGACLCIFFFGGLSVAFLVGAIENIIYKNN